MFLSHDFGAILTERKAMVRAAMSESMWKESDIKAIELVTCPTVISTTKKVAVRPNMVSSRHFLPLNLPILDVSLPDLVFLLLCVGLDLTRMEFTGWTWTDTWRAAVRVEKAAASGLFSHTEVLISSLMRSMKQPVSCPFRSFQPKM